MTKEELKQEAEELIQRFEMANSMNCYMQLTPDRKQIGEMLVMIAEPREKRIAELETQIEKMKCCEMCKHKNLNWGFSSICEARDKIKIENPLTCKCDKWEIKK